MLRKKTPALIVGFVISTVILLFPNGAHANWKEKVLYTFTGGSDGGEPDAPLVFDGSGNLYGTASGGGNPNCQNGYGCGTVFELTHSGDGWTQTVLYSFNGPDGADPRPGLIFDSAGNLYGSTVFGGSSSSCTYVLGCGTVFELSPNGDGSWAKTTLYNFAGGNDGQNPQAALILDKDGHHLYGTTYYGGAGKCAAGIGCGTVFELVRSSGGNWTERVMYSFLGGSDGIYAVGGVVLGKPGNLYGTTERGGSNGCYGDGCGTIFRLKLSNGSWKETVLFRFSGSKDGAFPESGLIFDMAGGWYGTTSEGGNLSCNVFNGIGGCGTVFRLSRSRYRWRESVLYSFTAGTDGAYPLDNVILHGASLYATTSVGGNAGCYGGGCGTVFKLTRSSNGWKEKVLYRFTGGDDGAYPFASPIFDAVGNLYAPTNNGGPNQTGVVFELKP
jgi:uncharacterized repeat protein (TIGR03803 family)